MTTPDSSYQLLSRLSNKSDVKRQPGYYTTESLYM